jgi:hypothetical protein
MIIKSAPECMDQVSILSPLHFPRCVRSRNFQPVQRHSKIILRVTRKPSSSSSSSEEIFANVVFVRRNLRIRRLRPKQLKYFCLMTFYGWWLAASGGFCLEHDLNDVIKKCFSNCHESPIKLEKRLRTRDKKDFRLSQIRIRERILLCLCCIGIRPG